MSKLNWKELKKSEMDSLEERFKSVKVSDELILKFNEVMSGLDLNLCLHFYGIPVDPHSTEGRTERHLDWTDIIEDGRDSLKPSATWNNAKQAHIEYLYSEFVASLYRQHEGVQAEDSRTTKHNTEDDEIYEEVFHLGGDIESGDPFLIMASLRHESGGPERFELNGYLALSEDSDDEYEVDERFKTCRDAFNFAKELARDLESLDTMTETEKKKKEMHLVDFGPKDTSLVNELVKELKTLAKFYGP